MKHTQPIVLFLLFLLTGCSIFGDEAVAPIPTLIPPEFVPTMIALTLQAGFSPTPPPSDTPLPPPPTRTPRRFATRTPYPTRTFTPTPTSTFTFTPTNTPTITLTPTETPTPTSTPVPEIGLAPIRISRPGPLSRVLSPIPVRANVALPPDGVFRIELIGEDGRLLARKVLTYPGIAVNLNTELEFGIAVAAETARLQIRTEDAYGRPLALGSVEIVLLSQGTAEITPAGHSLERIVILEPRPQSTVQGGTLFIWGKALPNRENALLVELITREGKVVGQRLAGLTPLPGEVYQHFEAEVPYNVREATVVRVVITERDSRIPGPTHITTMEILLNP